jgi:SNF2 family DNA or RNA helicase
VKLELHPYQKTAVKFLLEKLTAGQGAAIFLDPGLGKTVVTLEALASLDLLGAWQQVLICAPLRVMGLVWPKEIEQWGYNFDYCILHGSNKAKYLNNGCEVHLINTDGVRWLAKQDSRPKYDLVIVDESSCFKSWNSQRQKALSKICNGSPTVILTGTPAANSYHDLGPQMKLVDQGKSLCTTEYRFKAKFCQKIMRGPFPEYVITEAGRKLIDKQIAPMVLRMSAEDYLDMPDRVYRDVIVQLPRKARAIYEKAERAVFTELENGTLDFNSPTSSYAKCRQIANGGVYVTQAGSDTRESEHIHDAKTDAVSEILGELQGKPALCLYQTWHDLERLHKRFPDAPAINGKTNSKQTQELIKRFRAGGIQLLLAQPAAMSHGVDGLQGACADVIWYGLSDKPETVQQAEARIYRQGQKQKQVRIHRIVSELTIDEVVLGRLAAKAAGQKALFDALKKYREKVLVQKTGRG